MYYVTKDFLDLIDYLYPITITNKAYRRFLAYLLFGKIDNELGLPVLSYTRIACIEFGYKEGLNVASQKHYNSTMFLQSFQRDVMTEDTFMWTGKGPNQARTALVIWPDELDKALQEEIKSFTTVDKYDLITGNKYTKRDVAAYRVELAQQVEQVIARTITPQQRVIIDYLHSLNIKFFTALTTSTNIGNTFLEVSKIEEPLTLKHQASLLHKIFTDPKPLYQPSINGNTERIFPYNESILGLKKNLRKTLCKGWIEFDLASSQLAIISRLWGVDELRIYLEEGNSIWTDLITYLNLTPSDITKKHLKTALYGICFGMSKKNVGDHIDYHFSAKELFFKHPVIQCLFKARSKRIAFIINRGSITTVYGKTVYLSGKTKADKMQKVRSMLAEEAQALEAKLLEDVIPLAKTTKDFVVTLWQSDGFSVRFTNKTKQQRWIKRIVDIVKAKADLYKVPTHLEVEVL